MEARAYPTVPMRSTGWRRSSRLAELQTADAPRDGCEDGVGARGAGDGGCSGEDDEQSTGSSEDSGAEGADGREGETIDTDALRVAARRRVSTCGIQVSSWAEVLKHRAGRAQAEVEAVKEAEAARGTQRRATQDAALGQAAAGVATGRRGDSEAGQKRAMGGKDRKRGRSGMRGAAGAAGGREDGVRCPAGHRARRRVAPIGEAWRCDGCGEELDPGGVIYSCEPCDYDLCRACGDGEVGEGARRSLRRRARSLGPEEEGPEGGEATGAKG